jgi:hypothetical protein
MGAPTKVSQKKFKIPKTMSKDFKLQVANYFNTFNIN